MPFSYIYGPAGMVDWQSGVLLAVGGMTAVSSGVARAHRLPERRYGEFLP